MSAVYGSARTSPIRFPGRPGRPKSGHKAGTSVHETRVNSGRRSRRRAPEAPLAKPIAPDQLLLDVRQAAVVLGVGVSTVWSMLRGGRLSSVDVGVRRVLIRREQVQRLAGG